MKGRHHPATQERLIQANDRPRRFSSDRIGVLVIAAVLGLALLSAPHLPLGDWIAALRTQADQLGIWAPVLIIGLFYLLSVAALPTLLVVVASGATFGLWAGFFGIWIGYVLAAGTVWVASRWFTGPLRARFVRLHPGAERILAAVARRGGWLVFLTQLHPMSPNGILNWLYRSAGIEARHALAAIGLGRAPTLWLYSALGAWSVEGLTAEHDPWWWFVSGLAAVAVLFAIGWLVTRALGEAAGD
ncbi:VTT domain-containing protein [Thioalkalicoccus limnaeus]|uniref:TVP38/TMEM64 family membrane protein n=1 Tax=Thioalkalicoccus limnaeus TaxID=120681 RepID=A0ABV4BHN0_9GAMM